MKKGYPQNLNNGVISRPENPGPQSRAGTQQEKLGNMDFFGNIADGDNEKGQITFAPAKVVRSGECIYDQENYPKGYKGGTRWDPKGKSKY